MAKHQTADLSFVGNCNQCLKMCLRAANSMQNVSVLSKTFISFYLALSLLSFGIYGYVNSNLLFQDQLLLNSLIDLMICGSDSSEFMIYLIPLIYSICTTSYAILSGIGASSL